MSEEREFTTSMGKLAGIVELNNRFKWFLGEEEPSPTYPFLIWAKPSANAIYMRKITNDAWIKIADLSGTAEQIKSHTHTRSQITDFPTAMPADGGDADTVDGYHASEIWTRVTPSNTTILSSTSYAGSPSTDYNLAKQFQVRYPGRYRISFVSSSLTKVKITLDDQAEGIEMEPGSSTVTLDLPHVPWGGIISVYVARKQSSNDAFIYNCYLRGSITTSRPDNSVLVG